MTDTPDENFLNLENFLNGLEPAQYINKVSQSISDKTQNYHSSKYIDPAPYMATFGQIQTSLNRLSEECKRKRKILEKSVDEKEQTHYKNVIQQSGYASDLKSTFNQLNATVEKLGATKIEPLGEKLKKSLTIKESSNTLIKLTRAYNNFYTTGQPSTDLLKSNTETAKTLKQLISMSSKLSQGDQLPKGKETEKYIIEFATEFEGKMLNHLNSYYHAQNYDRLSLITEFLFEFNNGQNIVKVFIENHQFFGNIQKEKKDVNIDWLNQISDPYFSSYDMDKKNLDEFNKIKDAISYDIGPFVKIFGDNSERLILEYITDIFDKILTVKVETILNEAIKLNKLCYLRALQLCFNEIYHVISELKKKLQENSIDISVDLEKIQANIFQKHLNNESYFSLEKSNLESLIDELTKPFINHNLDVIKKQYLSEKINIVKEQQDIDGTEEDTNDEAVFISEDNQTLSSSQSLNSKGSSKSKNKHQFDFYLPNTRILKEKFHSAKKKIPRSNRLKKFVAHTPFMKNHEKNDNFSIMGFTSVKAPESSGSEVEFQVSLQISENIYKFVLESLIRSTGLVPLQMNQYTKEIFEIMLNKIGPSYISVGLGSLYHNNIYPFQPGFRSRSILDLDVNFLSQIRTVSLQLYVMSTVIKKSFYPLIDNSVILDKLSLSFNGYVQDVEIAVNVIIDEMIKLVETEIETILKSQSTTDYVTPHDDCTSACDQLCKFLEPLFQSIQTQIEFSSLLKMGIITKISSHLLSTLIFHFTKFSYNEYGITTLADDAVQYLSLFNVLRASINENKPDIDLSNPNQLLLLANDDKEYEDQQIEHIQNAFQILNDLPGLFNSSNNEQLKDFTNEGRLKYLKKDVLDKFINKRKAYQASLRL